MRIAVRCTLLLILALFSACGTETDGTHAQDPEVPSGNEVNVNPGPPPNVVWILLDALRADHLSSYGYHRPTSPFIDSIAQRGTLFENHFAQGSNTLMSVASYMTGRYFPVEYQDARFLDIWFLKEPPENELLVSDIFRRNGYTTAMFSASPWFTEASRLAESFDTFEELAWYWEPALAKGSFEADNPELFAWIEQHSGTPFFLYVHSLDTHEPRFGHNTLPTWLDPTFPPDRADELRAWKNGPFSPADQQYINDLYDGGIAYADQTIASIAKALEREGLLDNTVIVVSSDHGEVLAQDGVTLGHPSDGCTDDQIRTPLIIAGPGVPVGKRVTMKSENVDIVPTLVELTGVSSPAEFDGVSLVATMERNPGRELREYAFTKTSDGTLILQPNFVFTFDDLKFEIRNSDDEALAMFGIPLRPRTASWKLPDAAGSRTPAQPATARLQAVDKAVESVNPLLARRDRQPEVIPAVFESPPGVAFVEEGTPYPIVAEMDASDNLWTSVSYGGMFQGDETYLVSFPGREDPPAMIMVARARNGTYRVDARIRSIESPDGVARGASFRFAQLDADSEYRLFELPASDSEGPNKTWVTLGTYTVSENKFVYYLDTGDPDDVAVFGNLRFVRSGEDHELLTDEERAAEAERLDALGYGDW